MIARHWRGWTKPEDAEAYERLLRSVVLPSLETVAGYRGGYILRSDPLEENVRKESEFVVINFFDSLDAVRRFAGDDYCTPVFEPEARRLLSRVESVAAHYQVRANTAGLFHRDR